MRRAGTPFQHAQVTSVGQRVTHVQQPGIGFPECKVHSEELVGDLLQSFIGPAAAQQFGEVVLGSGHDPRQASQQKIPDVGEVDIEIGQAHAGLAGHAGQCDRRAVFLADKLEKRREDTLAGFPTFTSDLLASLIIVGRRDGLVSDVIHGIHRTGLTGQPPITGRRR